ncbi:MAG TPA: TMEM43 family protein [Rudaea sp.]|nr:TMEM43 family protein [Rudaea sp.]
MTRRKRKSRGRIAAAILILGVIAGAGWFGYRHLDRVNQQVHDSGQQKIPVKISSERVDPANEGLRVQLGGRLEAGANARDSELGISARAALLSRKVEMYQWREHCAGATCDYEPVWSSLPMDSHNFRQPHGHENPPMRLVDANFAGADLRLGAFTIDPALVAAQVALVDHPVHAAELPPNLAASFAEVGGVLYAGGNSQPRVGEVRVSYRIAPLGNVVLTGVQRGSRLTAE